MKRAKEEMHTATEYVIGRRYHIAWAKKGCVWKLKKMNGDIAILETASTKKEIRVHKNQLMNTRKNEKD